MLCRPAIFPFACIVSLGHSFGHVSFFLLGFLLCPCCVPFLRFRPFLSLSFPFSLPPPHRHNGHQRHFTAETCWARTTGAGAGCLALKSNSQSSDTGVIHPAQWLDIPAFNLPLPSQSFGSLPSVPATRVAFSGIAAVSRLFRSTGRWAEQLEGHLVHIV